MFPEKLKRDDLFHVQRLPRWLFGVIAGVALLLIVFPALSGRSAGEAPRFITVEMPSPQFINQGAAQPGLLIDWAYTEEAARQNLRGERFYIWQRETVCYDCGTAEAISAYFDQAFREDGWQRREGDCALARTAGQIALADEVRLLYAPPTELSRWAEACILIRAAGQTGTFRVLLLTINPA